MILAGWDGKHPSMVSLFLVNQIAYKSAPAQLHITRLPLPWTESSKLTSSFEDLGSHCTLAAVRTALHANLASGHWKKTWLASSGAPHNAHGPVAGPLRLATFREVGSLLRNNCHKKSLIFRGNRADHKPLTTSCAGP